MCKRKTIKPSKSAKLNQVMIRWFKLHENEGVKLSDDLVKEQTRIFNEELELEYQCGYTEGLLQCFKDRYGLMFHAVCGEKRSADREAASKFVDEFANLISDKNLSPDQIYNTDETALFWKCTPKRALKSEDTELPIGYKASKDCVTALSCSNAAGTKLLVIVKGLRTQAFKGMIYFPVIYHANKKVGKQLNFYWIGFITALSRSKSSL